MVKGAAEPRLFRPWLILLALLMLSTAAAASDGRLNNSGLSEPAVREFLVTLQDAVKRNDAAAVAALVEYPVRINARQGRSHIGNPRAFAFRYYEIFDHRVRNVVLKQRFEDLFSNSRGIMLGAGEVWFSGICDATSAYGACDNPRIRIIAINR